MAIIKCPECGKEVSDDINNCIYCGCPLDHSVEIIFYIADDSGSIDVVLNDLDKIEKAIGCFQVNVCEFM